MITITITLMTMMMVMMMMMITTIIIIMMMMMMTIIMFCLQESKGLKTLSEYGQHMAQKRNLKSDIL